MNTAQSRMGIGTRDVYQSSLDYRDVRTRTAAFVGQVGAGPGTIFVTTTGVTLFNTDVVLVGIELSCSFTITLIRSMWCGVVRGIGANQIIFLQGANNVLALLNHSIGVGAIAGIPASKTIFVGYTEPYFPIIKQSEPLATFAANDLAAAEDQTGLAVYHYIPLTARSSL